MKLKVRREVDAKYLDVTAAVRYGDEDIPPDAPGRTGDTWHAVIDLDEGRVVDWPAGRTLSMDSMKVCDEGVYVLLDDSQWEITRIEGYVPNRLLPGSYGDYLSLEIDGTGKVTNWPKRPSLADFETDDD